MVIKERYRSSKEGFNIYAHIWTHADKIKCFDSPYGHDMYVRIVEDHGGYLEIEPLSIITGADSLCPECKQKHGMYEHDATWFIDKDVIAMIRIEDKVR